MTHSCSTPQGPRNSEGASGKGETQHQLCKHGAFPEFVCLNPQGQGWHTAITAKHGTPLCPRESSPGLPPQMAGSKRVGRGESSGSRCRRTQSLVSWLQGRNIMGGLAEVNAQQRRSCRAGISARGTGRRIRHTQTTPRVLWAPCQGLTLETAHFLQPARCKRHNCNLRLQLPRTATRRVLEPGWSPAIC